MDRPIEFRAWDDFDHGMKYNIRLSATGKALQFIQHDGDNEMKWPIMQFTGLLDKNDKKIFEGDIVNFYVGTDKRQFTATIQFCSYTAMFNLSVDESSAHIYGFNDAHDEIVIGNIFENPELLEKS
jgi:uncharacterized phage protein (TIGR01671 family)